MSGKSYAPQLVKAVFDRLSSHPEAMRIEMLDADAAGQAGAITDKIKTTLGYFREAVTDGNFQHQKSSSRIG